MLLYLLRHADAESMAPSDAQRMLTPKGIAQAGVVAAFCKRQEMVPERLLTSPFVRTRQTAQLVGDALGIPPEEAPFLASGMSPESAINELRVHTSVHSMMLVGHEPDLSHLISHVVGSVSINIRKASLTLVECSSLRPGTGILHFSIPVKFMHL